MRKLLKCVFLTVVLICISLHIFSQKPFIQEGSADPSTMVAGDIDYVYPSHDFNRENKEFTMYDYKVYSSKDLINWEDNGVTLMNYDIPWCKNPSSFYDPSAIHVNGRTYFYFFVSRNIGNRPEAGVVVSDSPTGPYRLILAHLLQLQFVLL